MSRTARCKEVWSNNDQPPPSAAAMAASAASALEPSGPPACAMSARPPPPLPPSTSAPLRTRSIAEKRDVRSSVTPTTTPALPSSVTPTMATTPEPRRFLPSSARLRRSLRSMPSTARAGSDRAVAERGDDTDIARALDVGAAAELHRPAHGVAAASAHGDDAHLVAIFLAEQRARPRRDRFIDGHQPRGHRRILQHEI